MKFQISVIDDLANSGTPFKALSTGEFIEEQIFNWTYTDEQRAKQNYSQKYPAHRATLLYYLTPTNECLADSVECSSARCFETI